MRNVTILLAVLAMAVPAFGAVNNSFTPTGTATWHSDSNWGLGHEPASTVSGETAVVGNGGTAVVTGNVPPGSTYSLYAVSVGGTGTSGGEIVLQSGTFTPGNWVTIGNGGLPAATAPGIFTQEGGTLRARIEVAESGRWSNQLGWGEFHISGGQIGKDGGSWSDAGGIEVGVRYNWDTGYRDGTGLFEVIGAAATIGAHSTKGLEYYRQGAASTLRIVPDASAALSVITVGGSARLDANATVGGALYLDDDNFTPVADVTDIVVLTCTGTLDVTGLTFSSKSGDSNWEMYTTTGSGTLGVRYIPEPATLALLGLGGLGVLLRRRKK